MEGQMHISDLALDAVVIQANYRPGQGWDLALQARRNGQTWGDTTRRLYSYLTTDELLQVVDDEMARAVGGGD